MRKMTNTKLSIKAIEEARKTLQDRLLPDGTILKLGQRIDILPPPQTESKTAFGISGKKYRAIRQGNKLQWQPEKEANQ